MNPFLKIRPPKNITESIAFPSMASIASPFPKSRPFSSVNALPLKEMCLQLKVLTFNQYNPKFYQQNTYFERQRLSLFAISITNRCNGKLFAMSGGDGALLEPEAEAEEKNYGRILLSDVVMKRKSSVFSGRKWNSFDIATAGVVLAMHFVCLFAPFYFTWTAFWVALGLYVVTGLLGITLSFHRNLSHRSFKLPKWLEYTFAYCGVQALQGNPIDWVSTHRYHHQFCDSERDPHSPIEGFWFSHMNWLFDTSNIAQRCGGPNNVGDLEKQSFYKFIQNTYILHPISLAALLYSLGGFPFLVWGMGVRIVWVFHITWLVNSACHVWGRQAWNTGDLSRNNWWVALLAFGEGWHNNHHAFEYSARHGLEWWQIDMTWYVVRFLQAVGLATDVKLPSENQKQRMAFNN